MAGGEGATGLSVRDRFLESTTIRSNNNEANVLCYFTDE